MTPYDHAPPVAPPSEETASAKAPALKGSGSQKRQRMNSVKIALTPDEYREVMGKAADTGLSASSFGRAVMLGTEGPRAKRKPHVNAVLLGHAVAQLKKAGNNLNQITHVLNAHGLTGSPREMLATLAKVCVTSDEVLETVAAIRELVGRKGRE